MDSMQMKMLLVVFNKWRQTEQMTVMMMLMLVRGMTQNGLVV
jgi:hypothetical protein